MLARVVVGAGLPKEELTDVMWAICKNSEGPKSRLTALMQANNFIPKIIQICQEHYNDKTILIPALRIVGSISSGNELHTE